VDDESAILAIVQTTLENFDYRVITAASGPDAVARLSEAGTPVQLIVANAAMHLMDGTPIIDALKRIKPDVKVILVNGVDTRAPGKSSDQFKSDAEIHKPFTVEKLVTAVHEVFSKKQQK
jgi:DNA-binding NtrC family response regulator